MKINLKDRSYECEKYLNFIRQFPCIICGRVPVQAHHVYVTGRKGCRNDFYAIPLCSEHHTSKGHITLAQLENEIREDARDRCIAYLSLWNDYMVGDYIPADDQETGWHILRSIMEGVNKRK